MKGEVEKKWKNETTDGRKYEVFQINRERYSLWDEDYLDRINEGQSLEFDFKESGEFKNITEIYGPSRNKEKEPGYEDRKNSQIVRMSSLRSASKILSSSRIPCRDRVRKKRSK